MQTASPLRLTHARNPAIGLLHSLSLLTARHCDLVCGHAGRAHGDDCPRMQHIQHKRGCGGGGLCAGPVSPSSSMPHSQVLHPAPSAPERCGADAGRTCVQTSSSLLRSRARDRWLKLACDDSRDVRCAGPESPRSVPGPLGGGPVGCAPACRVTVRRFVRDPFPRLVAQQPPSLHRRRSGASPCLRRGSHSLQRRSSGPKETGGVLSGALGPVRNRSLASSCCRSGQGPRYAAGAPSFSNTRAVSHGRPGDARLHLLRPRRRRE